jgi:hypothetical protein
MTSSPGEPVTPTPSPIALAALAQLNMGRVLNPLVRFFTAISFYFHLRQTVTPAFVLRYDPDVAYIFLLTAYAGHRELRRWSNDPEVMTQRARRGEAFVVFWWAFYGFAVVAANHLTRYRVPEGLLSLCIQVTTIFFGTLTSQQLYKRRLGRMDRVEADGETLDYQILEQIRGSKESVRPLDIETRCGASRSTVYRVTRRLVAAGKIEWTGRNENDPEGGFRLKLVMN